MTEQPLAARVAMAADAAVVAGQRARMFMEMGRLADEGVPELLRVTTAHLEQALADASYRHWLMELPHGRPVGGAGVLLRPLLPRPDALRGPEAVVLNVYVEPEFRRRGIARLLMNAVLDWCRQEQIQRIVLHPTPNGQPLYESLGFRPTGEMIYRPDLAAVPPGGMSSQHSC